jgi:hypothetical protein
MILTGTIPSGPATSSAVRRVRRRSEATAPASSRQRGNAGTAAGTAAVACAPQRRQAGDLS